MTNIFGKNQADYSFIMDAKSKGVELEGLSFQDHAINFVQVQDSLSFNGAEFLRSNRAAILSEVLQVQYSIDDPSTFIPINSTIPQGAKSYVSNVRDFTGKGKRITSLDKDIPLANVGYSEIPTRLYDGGVNIKYSITELRDANFLKISLDTDKIQAAVVGANEHLEEVAFIGDNVDGVQDGVGIVNNYVGNASVTDSNSAAPYSATTIDTTTQTGDQIYDSLVKIIAEIMTQGENVVKNLNNLTLACTHGFAAKIASTKFANTESTVLKRMKEDNPFTVITGKPLVIKGTSFAKNVNAVVDSGHPDIAVFYFNDKTALEMALPIAPNLLDWAKLDARTYQSSIDYKYGLVNFKHPKLFRAFGTK